MRNKRLETFVYEDLGFPVELVDAPMRKALGEWVIDIDLNELQRQVLQELVHQVEPFSGAQVRFIRKYFELTKSAFGALLGVTHAAVIKWEEGGQTLTPTTEFYLRVFCSQ